METETATNTDYENMTASQLFEQGWRLQQEMAKSSDEMSEKFAIERKKAIELLQRAQQMLDELHLFSKNESIDEVSTSELKYMINDALLGWLYAKVNATKPDVRFVALEQAKQNIIRFLKLTKNYELHNYAVGNENGDHRPQNDNTASIIEQNSERNKQAAFDANLINSAHDRNEKIKRFKEQKEFEAKLVAFKKMATGGGDYDDDVTMSNRLDDEERRKFYIILVKYWLNKSLDDLKVINDEITILQTFQESGSGDQAATANKPTTSSSAVTKKPFIITKDVLQAQVFGAGYPSVPVYSIEQFYDKLADEGKMPKHDNQDPNEEYAPVKIGGGVTESQKQKEKAEKDAKEDAYDDDELRKQREWDEFKDENKRGAGNRFNRS